MNQKLLLFTCKLLLLGGLVGLLLLPLARAIHDHREKYEPRSSLLYRGDLGDYSFAILGDSVFNSRYVDKDSDAIWNKFTSFTGIKCFPGSLYAATLADLVNAAKYLSLKMPRGSTVFIDVLPLKFLGSGNDHSELFGSMLSDRLLEEKYPLYRIYTYLNLDYLKYFSDRIHGEAEMNRSVYHNRTWNVDGAPADMEHFKNNFVRNYKDALLEDMQPLREIDSVLKEKGLRPVFVVTPINKEMMESCPDRRGAAAIYEKVLAARGATRRYLDSMDAAYLDLFDAIPATCFSDLVHTNACGDEIIAKSLARYVQGKGRL
jgi:hypothetical protein